ncbi:VOC family protein [Acinetobacter stercoris]|uniref:Glyoxalase/Bleomycin resistance protein/Dioxygenase superfamily protein n=1 Tax=Acinetobacter stercoris TaxID=2126983 RepID=A0A2U3N0Y4_9GAMM|nr:MULTISPECIES: VOC family protein [Acinetobacter]SPL71322.1 Glyoxalase/Bleomycin resistance protein/Dioxygenase superfamily protein [Acinetobacter stercoris]
MKNDQSTKSELGRTILSADQHIDKISIPVQSLHHAAYFCYDAEETRHFYEDLLGWPLVHALRVDERDLPSPAFTKPYMHLFFELEDKSCIAFFDILDEPTSAMTTPHPPINHIAFKVSNREQLLTAKARLEAAGVPVVGALDHGFVESIYFEDPNGVNLELTFDSAGESFHVHARETARDNLKAWSLEKSQDRKQTGVA